MEKKRKAFDSCSDCAQFFFKKTSVSKTNGSTHIVQ